MFQDPRRVAAAGIELVSEHFGRLDAVGQELRLEFFFGQPAQLVFQFKGAYSVEDIA